MTSVPGAAIAFVNISQYPSISPLWTIYKDKCLRAHFASRIDIIPLATLAPESKK